MHATRLPRRNPGLTLWTASRALVCALVLGSGAGLAAGAELAVQHAVEPMDDGLGTLFYSAAERAAIAQARQGEVGATLLSTRMTVNGLVKRTGGNSTAWVNGQAVVDGDSLRQAGKVSVQRHSVGLDGKSVRVGESLDLSTQDRTDIVAPGAVTVKDKK